MKQKTARFTFLPIAIAVSGALYQQSSLAQESQDEPLVEVIQVSGIRSSLTKSMDLKKNAPSIQDSIVAEDIGKFPDQNVAESLQRITGVSISRVNGEGSKITVRGFGPKFNAVNLNGRTLATTDRGREFDFQVLPSELISGADVVKASRANITEGSLGAYVNVTTAKPLDNPGFHGVASASLKYNDLSEKYDPKVSGIVSNTFADDTIGVLFGFSQLKATNRIDSAATVLWANFDASNKAIVPGTVTSVDGSEITEGVVWYPGRAQYSLETEERDRTSANLTLQYAPNDDSITTLDFIYSDLSRQGFSNGMQVPLQQIGWEEVIVSENRTALAATKNASPIDGLFQQVGQDSETFSVGLNHVHMTGNWTFEGDLSYSKAEASPRGNTFVPHYVNHTVDQSVSPDDPNFRPNQDLGLIIGQDNIKFDSRNGDVISVTSTIDWANPSSVRAHWNDIRHQELDDEILQARFDVDYALEYGSLISVEAGISYSDREKSQVAFLIDSGCANNSIEDLNLRALTNTCGTSKDLDDDLFQINSNNGFLSDVAGQFPRDFVLITDLERFKDDIGILRNEPDWDTESIRANQTVSNTEEILALYTQFNFEGDIDNYRWNGNVGLRYVDTETTSSGFGRERISIQRFVDPARPDSTDGVVLAVDYTEPGVLTAQKDYQELLPSMNFSLDFDNGFFLKLAASKVITRPALEDIGVNRSYRDARAEDFRSTGGNPNLDPYKATQFDVSFEYYADSGSSYAVNFFRKDIDTFISTLTFQEDTGVVIDGWGPLIETITEKGNRTGGEINGVEIAGLHYFDYLPEWASGFGIQANYTYTDSEDKNADIFEQAGVTSPGTGLEGFSKNAYNVIGFYDKDGFQARLAYNWRDTFLSLRQGNRSNGLPEHIEAYGQLDFSTSYDINETFTIKGEVINLTDENALEYADVRERVTLVSYSGRRFEIGVTAKF